MISKTGIHAALAFSILSQLGPDEYAGAGKIAEAIGAPRNYLGKLLKDLAARGMLESQKGHGGGFRLAKSADKISLFDVVEPIDHVSKWNGCFLGREKCSDHKPCAVHKQWSQIRNQYLKFLKDTTIANLD